MLAGERTSTKMAREFHLMQEPYEPKFRLGEEVRATKGLYRGWVGIVKDFDASRNEYTLIFQVKDNPEQAQLLNDLEAGPLLWTRAGVAADELTSNDPFDE